MLDLERVAASAAPAFESDHAVGDGMHGRAFRCGVIDARMRAVYLVDRMFAGVGEFRADARIFQRRLEHLLAQACAVIFPVADFAALPERNGVVLLAALTEFRAPDAADADRDAVVDEPLVIDDREVVAFLDAEEVHRPLVNVLHFGGQRIGQLLLHDSAPERRVDRGALLGAAHGKLFFARADAHRVVVESEDHVFGDVAFVNQIIQVRGIERILVDEGRVLVSRADVAQRENILRSLVEPVDRQRRNAESVQDFAQRFAASHLAGLGAVIVGVDAVYDVVLLGGFLPGRLLLLRSAARPRRNQQQGAYG